MKNIHIQDDEPVSSAKFFNFDAYAEALTRIIAHNETKTPLAAGIFGEWGSGKTSLMLTIEKKLNGYLCWDEIPGNDSNLLLEFIIQKFGVNWARTAKIEKTDDAKTIKLSTETNFLSFVLNKEKTKAILTIDDGRTDEFFAKIVNGKINIYKINADYKIKTIWFNAWEQSYAQSNNLSGPSLLYCIYNELGGKDSKSEKIKMLGRGILGIVGEIGSRKYLGLTWGEVLNQFEAEVKSRKSFSESFRSAIKDYLKKEKCQRVVIFIDDLDRCLPENVVEILESIKLFLNAENCIFVLGMDREVITKCIRVRHKDFNSDSSDNIKINGDDYLEKIIQLSFMLPPLSKEKMKDFLSNHDLNESYKPYYDMIIKGIGLNPRKIKRFMNVIEFQRNLSDNIEDIKEIKEKSKESFDALLIEWQIISSSSNSDYIDFRKHVLRRPGLLLKMHNYIESDLQDELLQDNDLQLFSKNQSLIELIQVFPHKGALKDGDVEIINKVIHLSSVTGLLVEKVGDKSEMTREEVIMAIRKKDKKSLENVDFSNVDLFKAPLSNEDLSDVDLSGAHFNQAILSGANLSRAILNEAILYGADLSGARLIGAMTDGVVWDSQTNTKGIILVDETISKDIDKKKEALKKLDSKFKDKILEDNPDFLMASD